ncbi:MAG: UDP-N-acetylmuramoyl-tripeptide--D-alanyl-D-alanine ligase [Bacilli bacterium]|nr:UDP-N-acetylmuramoyl-tripeptide--D-alanyl-D-alanine ligase [Bacilli bacterium]
MTRLFYLAFIFLFLIAVIKKTTRALHMLQQNLYNENNRYLKWVFKNIKEFFNIELVALITSLYAYYTFAGDHVYTNIMVFILMIIYILSFITIMNIERKNQNKKPLVYTARVKRLLVTISILYLIPILIMFLDFDNPKTVWLVIVILTFMSYFNYFVVYLAKLINTPIEKQVFYHFRRKAKSKLASMTHLKVIGITGSYGKTSSKRILADILNIKYNAYPSPRNLNTPNGLMMTINNTLDKFTDIFIAEMGAYKKGEIKELCDLVEPKYGILTRIGTAHLESFGSEENIRDGKFELIESLPEDGFAILNKDDPKQVEYELKNKVKVIWIGIEENADYQATNIKCNHEGTTFDLKIKGDKKKYQFTTKLLGYHNVYNILAGIACGREFGIPMDKLIQAVRTVKPIEHRLEIKKLGGFYQIDDAYNSNPIGAKSAMTVLGMFDGIKVVVTPGMIELGDKEDYYNKELGKQIATLSDANYVVLIGEKKTKPIYEGLIEEGYPKDNIITYNNVKDAYKFIGTLTGGKEKVYALFENDLPDTYNE